VSCHLEYCHSNVPDVHSVMLNTQYRMHPDISRFPAEEFYEFELRDGTVDKAGDALPGLEPPISTHLNFRNKRPSVIFVDHGGNESMKGRSRVNVTEAHLVASVVEDLLLVNKVCNFLIYYAHAGRHKFSMLAGSPRPRYRNHRTLRGADHASSAFSQHGPSISRTIQNCSWRPTRYANAAC